MASTPSKSSSTTQDTKASASAVKAAEANSTTNPDVPPAASTAGPEQRGAAEPSATTTQTRTEDLQPGDEGYEPQEKSTTVAAAGNFLLYRHPSAGPVMALVTTAGTGDAEVLVMRDSEVPRARAVSVYDSAEDAERGAAEGLEHVAYHLP